LYHQMSPQLANSTLRTGTWPAANKKIHICVSSRGCGSERKKPMSNLMGQKKHMIPVNHNKKVKK
jgi:hypothetical protein